MHWLDDLSKNELELVIKTVKKIEGHTKPKAQIMKALLNNEVNLMKLASHLAPRGLSSKNPKSFKSIMAHAAIEWLQNKNGWGT